MEGKDYLMLDIIVALQKGMMFLLPHLLLLSLLDSESQLWGHSGLVHLCCICRSVNHIGEMWHISRVPSLITHFIVNLGREYNSQC